MTIHITALGVIIVSAWVGSIADLLHSVVSIHEKHYGLAAVQFAVGVLLLFALIVR